MGKKGFAFNQDDCIGCKTCQMACKDKNDLPVGILFRNVKSYEVGDFPNASLYHFSATCNHCAKPACVASCPMRALSFGEMRDLTGANKGAVRDLPIRPDSKLTGACTLIKPKAAALEDGAREVVL